MSRPAWIGRSNPWLRRWPDQTSSSFLRRTVRWKLMPHVSDDSSKLSVRNGMRISADQPNGPRAVRASQTPSQALLTPRVARVAHQAVAHQAGRVGLEVVRRAAVQERVENQHEAVVGVQLLIALPLVAEYPRRGRCRAAARRCRGCPHRRPRAPRSARSAAGPRPAPAAGSRPRPARAARTPRRRRPSSATRSDASQPRGLEDRHPSPGLEGVNRLLPWPRPLGPGGVRPAAERAEDAGPHDGRPASAAAADLALSGSLREDPQTTRPGRRHYAVPVDYHRRRRAAGRGRSRHSRPDERDGRGGPRTTGPGSAASGPVWQRIAPTLPETWSRTENVVWKIEVPGQGWSSPIVWDDLVVVTSAVSDEPGPGPQLGLYDGHSSNAIPTAVHRWMVYGIDLHDGSIRWARDVRSAAPPIARHGKNTYASETPVTDGERVYAYFGGIGLFAFDLDGTPVWSHEMEVLDYRHGWGQRRVARAARGSPLRRQRQRGPVVHRRPSTSTPARSCGGWTATRAATGRRPSCGRTTSAPRS